VVAVQTVGLRGDSAFPCGSCEVTFEELDAPGRISGFVRAGGISQAVRDLVATTLLRPIGIACVRAGRLQR
jgi:hypothetical protein